MVISTTEVSPAYFSGALPLMMEMLYYAKYMKGHVAITPIAGRLSPKLSEKGFIGQ
jgi:hypothetical protein